MTKIERFMKLVNNSGCTVDAATAAVLSGRDWFFIQCGDADAGLGGGIVTEQTSQLLCSYNMVN